MIFMFQRKKQMVKSSEPVEEGSSTEVKVGDPGGEGRMREQ